MIQLSWVGFACSNCFTFKIYMMIYLQHALEIFFQPNTFFEEIMSPNENIFWMNRTVLK